jgi:crotonobetainyl-CoA:carnitine CoA-transferase CaiB-like acyl-CoA transferase
VTCYNRAVPPPHKSPLDGIVVADFSRILAGPLATQLLSDAGARVIKIEERGRGDETRRWGPPFVEGESAYFLSVNRNKESITLDLKQRKGREVAKRIIAMSDVVIQNFREEQAKKFGLTAVAVRRINARAIFCSIRGFERDSEEASLPGYDLLAQAAGGLMAITGEAAGMPMKSGVALADVLSGHHAHGAILAALYQRERTGVGSSVEISLLGATASSLVNVAQSFLLTRREPRRYGNEHPSIVPYQAFATADRAIVIAVASDRHFEIFCREVLGDRKLATDERFQRNAGRVANRVTLIPLLGGKLQRKKADWWIARCHAAGIPAAKVQTFEEMFTGTAAPLLQSVDHSTIGPIEMVGSPARRDGKRDRVRSAPPTLGQHSDSLLRELGFSRDEITKLHAASVV